MNDQKRHTLIWKFLYPPVHAYFRRRYGYSFDLVKAERAYLLISNHATNFLDVMFIALAVGKRPITFVGSEHLMRSGFAGRLLRHCFGYISRPKGSQALSTVREIMKTLKSDMPVCLFAEGNCSWDGRNIPVVEGTGTLARACGVPLVTYRLVGGYLVRPRWSRGPRKGKVSGHCIGEYTPEQLKAHSSKEVNALIERDIHEDAWERQRREMPSLPGKRRAEYIERFLYLCPGCGRVGTLTSCGNSFCCSCGKKWTYSEYGFPIPAEPFSSFAEWEDWQKKKLCTLDFIREDSQDRLFSDRECILTRIGSDSSEQSLGTGLLIQHEDSVECAGYSFMLSVISAMDMVRHNMLLFTADGVYYQIRAGGRTNLRKYLEIWKANHGHT